MLQSTRPSMPAHPATHTSSPAPQSLHTPSLHMRMRCDTFFRCVCLVEQPAVMFLPTEHRNHRQVPPADCQCNATCTIHPCAKRQRRLCHGGAPRCLLYWRRRSRSERSESHLRSWDRRTGDQDHRGRCPADQSRPWGRIRGARGAID